MDLAKLYSEEKMLCMWQEHTLNSEWGLKLNKLQVPNNVCCGKHFYVDICLSIFSHF